MSNPHSILSTEVDGSSFTGSMQLAYMQAKYPKATALLDNLEDAKFETNPEKRNAKQAVQNALMQQAQNGGMDKLETVLEQHSDLGQKLQTLWNNDPGSLLPIANSLGQNPDVNALVTEAYNRSTNPGTAPKPGQTLTASSQPPKNKDSGKPSTADNTSAADTGGAGGTGTNGPDAQANNGAAAQGGAQQTAAAGQTGGAQGGDNQGGNQGAGDQGANTAVDTAKYVTAIMAPLLGWMKGAIAEDPASHKEMAEVYNGLTGILKAFGMDGLLNGPADTSSTTTLANGNTGGANGQTNAQNNGQAADPVKTRGDLNGLKVASSVPVDPFPAGPATKPAAQPSGNAVAISYSDMGGNKPAATTTPPGNQVAAAGQTGMPPKAKQPVYASLP